MTEPRQFKPTLYELFFDFAPHVKAVFAESSAHDDQPSSPGVVVGRVQTPTNGASLTSAPAASATSAESVGTSFAISNGAAPVVAPAPSSNTAPRSPHALPPLHEVPAAINKMQCCTKIHFTAQANGRNLVLSALALDVLCVRWCVDRPDAEETAKVVEGWRVTDGDNLRIDLGETVAENKQIILILDYAAPIAADPGALRGAFQADPMDRLSIATQLEPQFARCLFPCVDEPAAKAEFAVTVRYPAGYTCLSNGTVEADEKESIVTPHRESLSPHSERVVPMDEDPETPLALDPEHIAHAASSAVQSQQDNTTPTIRNDRGDSEGHPSLAPPGPEFRIARFARTPPISTYLVAVVIGKFHVLKAGGDAQTSVYVPTGDGGAVHTASSLLYKALTYFEQFFSHTLPLKKLDLVASPLLPGLAMENWGLMVFRKEFVLVTDKTSLERRRRITRLVAHEVSHHWFGNSVTLSKWNYLWLKEGLARYLEFVFTNAQHSLWEMWAHFIVDIQSPALLADATPSTHPVEQKGDLTSDDITASFDLISYGKGASIVRMMACLLEKETMRQALAAFVARHEGQDSAVTSQDFYVCLREAFDAKETKPQLPRDVTIESMMAKWISTSGHPLLYVTANAHEAEKDSTQNSVDGLGSPGALGAEPLPRAVHVVQHMCPDLPRGFIQFLGPRDPSPEVQRPQPTSDHSDGPLPHLGVFTLPPPGSTPSYMGSLPPLSSARENRLVRPPSVLVSYDRVDDNAAFPVPVYVQERFGSRVHPKQTHVMGEASFTIPLAADPTPEDEEHALAAVLVNSEGNVPCRVDYSCALWERLLHSYDRLADVQRVNIALTLFDLRPLMVGVTGVHDRSDRCVHIARLLHALNAAGERHSIVWDVVTQKLTPYVDLLKTQDCWAEFAAHIRNAHSGLRPSEQQAPEATVVSFFNRADDHVNSFDASTHMPQQTGVRIRTLLGRSGDSQAIGEARSYFEWVMHAWCDPPELEPIGGASMGEPLLDTPLASSTAPTAAPALSFPLAEDHAMTPCDLTQLPAENVAAAFRCALADCRGWYEWQAVLAVLRHYTPEYAPAVDDAMALVPGEHRCRVVIRDTAPTSARNAAECTVQWTSVLLSAAVAAANPELRTAQLQLLRRFNRVSDIVLEALLDNTQLLEHAVRDGLPGALGMQVARFAAGRTSSPRIVAWVKEQLAGSDLGQQAADSLVWAEYVSKHLTWFFRCFYASGPADRDALYTPMSPADAMRGSM